MLASFLTVSQSSSISYYPSDNTGNFNYERSMGEGGSSGDLQAIITIKSDQLIKELTSNYLFSLIQ
jgi:hypothetical protein